MENTMNDTDRMRQDAIDGMMDSINRMEEALRMSKGTIEGQNYIVMVHDIAVSPIIKNMKVVGQERSTVDLATRFTKEDAEMLAEGTVNGLGDVGYAVAWKDVTRDHIARLYDHVDMLKGEQKG